MEKCEPAMVPARSDIHLIPTGTAIVDQFVDRLFVKPLIHLVEGRKLNVGLPVKEFSVAAAPEVAFPLTANP